MTSNVACFNVESVTHEVPNLQIYKQLSKHLRFNFCWCLCILQMHVCMIMMMMIIIIITFRVRRSRCEQYIGHGRLCVCLSLDEFPHYCTDSNVTWRNGRVYPLVVHYSADLQSVYGFRCYDNIAPNVKCQRVLVLALCLVIMAALCNRGPLYFCPVISIFKNFYLLSSFFLA